MTSDGVTSDALTANLARSIVAQAAVRPDLKLGTVDDQVDLADAVGLAAGRARDLMRDGLRRSEPIALVAPTSTDYLITWLACLFAGAPVAMVNPTYPSALIDRMLAPLAPRLTMGPDEVKLARSAGPAVPTGLPGLDADALDVVSFMHTSGTTGVPKFCVQTHDYFRRLAMAMSGALDLRPTDRVLAPLPLFHINPMGYGIITALLTGADALTVTRFSASGFWPTVVAERITVLVLHAPPVEILKRATTHLDSAGHAVRTMFYADARFLRQFDVPAAVSGYGSTEAGGVSHLTRWLATDDIPGDAGRHGGLGRPDIEWRLDATGIIHLRERERAAMFDGYVTADGLDTARDDAGWFDSGDLGRVDGDGHLVFIERGAESIRVKGEFVPIPFVESHLAGIGGITDYAIWKQPGALVDDEVVLFVVADKLPVEALRGRIAELPTFMRPVAVTRLEVLPRDTAAGKVQRRLLGECPVLARVELR